MEMLKKTKLHMAFFFKQENVEDYTSDTTVMDSYFVTLDGRTSQSCHYCDVETYVKCLDVSHSEFNLNSINTDETIFMDMILASEVAQEIIIIIIMFI